MDIKVASMSWDRKPRDKSTHLWVPYLWQSESESEVAQLCPTLCDPVDCSPTGSSVHGILQARIMEWVAISLRLLIFLLAILIPACASSSPAFLMMYSAYKLNKRVSLVAQRLKCLPAIQETWVWSLGQEDTLEKEMATHSIILAWRIPWTEEPGGLQSTGS